MKTLDSLAEELAERDRELARLARRVAELEAVAEAACAFVASIGSFAYYRSGKWQASGGDEALQRLAAAVEQAERAARGEGQG